MIRRTFIKNTGLIAAGLTLSKTAALATLSLQANIFITGLQTPLEEEVTLIIQ